MDVWVGGCDGGKDGWVDGRMDGSLVGWVGEGREGEGRDIRRDG